jgi:hypothetical protein
MLRICFEETFFSGVMVISLREILIVSVGFEYSTYSVLYVNQEGISLYSQGG